MYYINVRWYDPSLGRFVTEDPIRDGINWYAYVSNNPLAFTDPTGLAPKQGSIDWLGGFLAATNRDYGADHLRNAEIARQEGRFGDAAQYAVAAAAEAATDRMDAAIQAETGASPVAAANAALKLSSTIATPHGPAIQDDSSASLDARAAAFGGATLYRLGTAGKSAAGEAQFWSLENPLTTPGYADKYGVPQGNIDSADFLETAILKDGGSFITRPAPGYGDNQGGGVEVVVPSGGVEVQTYTSLEKDPVLIGE